MAVFRSKTEGIPQGVVWWDKYDDTVFLVPVPGVVMDLENSPVWGGAGAVRATNIQVRQGNGMGALPGGIASFGPVAFGALGIDAIFAQFTPPPLNDWPKGSTFPGKHASGYTSNFLPKRTPGCPLPQVCPGPVPPKCAEP